MRAAAVPLPTVLTVHFGTPLVGEAALDFLARPERGAELVSRNGLADWAQALSKEYGLVVEAGVSPTTLRALLARQALTCELLETLSTDVPESLQRVISAADPLVARRAAELAREWRNRRDIAATYPGRRWPLLESVSEKSLHLVLDRFYGCLSGARGDVCVSGATTPAASGRADGR